MPLLISESLMNRLWTNQLKLKTVICEHEDLFDKLDKDPSNEELHREMMKMKKAVNAIVEEQKDILEMLDAEMGTLDIDNVPSTLPEEPTASIAIKQEPTIRGQASSSSATPDSSFGSTSTEECSSIHEMDAAKIEEEKEKI
ncbi:hypothetical protein WA026_022420 [Henosepilachna vigintioctopunctata]|uniref:Uncharacterized protein n=1 Tax=Henosepilachna vigintioctopunctata TaxID=420089 RepID=A0AAW1UEF6_9CUCU